MFFFGFLNHQQYPSMGAKRWFSFQGVHHLTSCSHTLQSLELKANAIRASVNKKQQKGHFFCWEGGTPAGMNHTQINHYCMLIFDISKYLDPQSEVQLGEDERLWLGRDYGMVFHKDIRLVTLTFFRRPVIQAAKVTLKRPLESDFWGGFWLYP